MLLTERNGEAAIERVQREHPEDGAAFVPAVVHVNGYEEDPTYRIDLPFDRYYLEQGSGGYTEGLLRGNTEVEGEEPREISAQAVVRVLDGKAVIEDLLIDGRSLRSWLGTREATESSPEME